MRTIESQVRPPTVSVLIAIELGQREMRGEISPNLVDGGWVFRRRPLIRRCSFRFGFRL
jgi:hypothetical protein